jgi:PBSX family phage terminase large subunit
VTTVVAPLVGKQRASVELATARINLWEGSVRSSKTVSSLIRWLQYTRTGPPGNLAMIGKTERTLKRNVIDPLIDMLGKKRCKPNWGDGELMLLGRRIYLAGANDERANEKIRGLTLAGAYVDEVSLLPESFWAMLLTRLSVEGAQLFGTTNPDNPNHWLLRDFLSRPAVWLRHDGTIERATGDALDLARFSFRLADNPSLPASYVAALAREFTGLWRLRFVEGLWVVAEGAIYDCLDSTPDADQVVTTLPVGLTDWTLAIDYGTTNPFVALLVGVAEPHAGQPALYVAREWRWDSKRQRRQLTDAEYSAELRKVLTRWTLELGQDVTPDRIYVDPSAASFTAQLWRDGWSGVHHADNAVVDGIRATASLLAGGWLKIHASCTGLIEEMTGYVWDTKAAAIGEEKPVKVADHGPDALRYNVASTRRIWRHWLTVEPPAVEAA